MSVDRGRLACCIPVKDPGPEFAQTLASFQTCSPQPYLIIVDDGSAEPIEVDFAELGLHGMLHRCPQNIGIARALNKALELAMGLGFEVISRMDGDDLNHPHRFQRQLAYLDAHPECLAVFGGADLIDERGAPAGRLSSPDGGRELLRAMALNNVLVHPTAALRRSYISRFGFYSDDFPFAEDYEFFLRGVVSEAIHVLPEPLIQYRVQQKSVSFHRYRAQLRSRLRVQLRYVRHFGMSGWVGVARTLGLLAGGVLLPTAAIGALRRSWLRAA